MTNEIYLGDGLYAGFDGWHIVLRAPREKEDHVVYLEPEVWVQLEKYVKTVYEKVNEKNK